MVTIASANKAAARLTKDSIASDSRPTEPVTHHAAVFKLMVATAASTDSLRKVRTEKPVRGRVDVGGATWSVTWRHPFDEVLHPATSRKARYGRRQTGSGTTVRWYSTWMRSAR